MQTKTVAERRNYRVTTVSEAKSITTQFIRSIGLNSVIELGLPEIDDRYHYWRVPLISPALTSKIGEVVIDAYTSFIIDNKTTAPKLLEARLLGRATQSQNGSTHIKPKQSTLRNTIGFGDCKDLLDEMPAESVDLIFTSPPYYNARPEYSDYLSYEDYLLNIRKTIHKCHRVLNEGRHFIMNISPVLIRRAKRSDFSRRIAVPFDIHRLFIEEGYDFIDDIIWEKPEGAGWASGRGRRFAADRNPLQYKPVPVTEYVLVYRKHTDKLIDWHIREHPNKQIVSDSKIPDGYERTNIWRISPARNKNHPAIFPISLAERVITYYSFLNDVVLDPFAGIGTVGEAAARLKRRFVLFENDQKYFNVIKSHLHKWALDFPENVIQLNTKLTINYNIDLFKINEEIL